MNNTTCSLVCLRKVSLNSWDDPKSWSKPLSQLKPHSLPISKKASNKYVNKLMIAHVFSSNCIHFYDLHLNFPWIFCPSEAIAWRMALSSLANLQGSRLVPDVISCLGLTKKTWRVSGWRQLRLYQVIWDWFDDQTCVINSHENIPVVLSTDFFLILFCWDIWVEIIFRGKVIKQRFSGGVATKLQRVFFYHRFFRGDFVDSTFSIPKIEAMGCLQGSWHEFDIFFGQMYGNFQWIEGEGYRHNNTTGTLEGKLSQPGWVFTYWKMGFVSFPEGSSGNPSKNWWKTKTQMHLKYWKTFHRCGSKRMVNFVVNNVQYIYI